MFIVNSSFLSAASALICLIPTMRILPVNVLHACARVRVAARVRMLLAAFVVLLVLLCFLRALGGLVLAEVVAYCVGLVGVGLVRIVIILGWDRMGTWHCES